MGDGGSVSAMRNIRMVIEYDGGAYCGWQRQVNGLSIQQVLEECIGRMTGEEIRVIGSGRTDAGVHALGQVAHFRTASRPRRVESSDGDQQPPPGGYRRPRAERGPRYLSRPFRCPEQGLSLPDLQPAGPSGPGEERRLVRLGAPRHGEDRARRSTSSAGRTIFPPSARPTRTARTTSGPSSLSPRRGMPPA